MQEDQIRQIIREELQNLFAADRYTFQKDLDIFDFRNIKMGKTTGTKIATEATQKLAFWGVTPRVQYPYLGPTLPDPSSTYEQSELLSMNDRINSLTNALVAVGITASS